jgi:hypothetical protein
MGIKEALQGAAQAAIAATGNIAVSTNYHAHVSTAYDASAGTDTTTFTTVTGVKVVFDEFRIGQIDGQSIKPEDKRAFVAQKDIPGVTPGANDQIGHGGQTWEVQRARVDPAGALWDLQVRRP